MVNHAACGVSVQHSGHMWFLSSSVVMRALATVARGKLNVRVGVYMNVIGQRCIESC
jgi:hypothetical protein